MPDPTTQQDEQTAARKKTTASPDTEPSTTQPATPDTSALYEPYPGAAFFHGGRNSPIVVAMARRLEAEGCADGRYLGPDWTNAHRDAFAAWQHQLGTLAGYESAGSGEVQSLSALLPWWSFKGPRR